MSFGHYGADREGSAAASSSIPPPLPFDVQRQTTTSQYLFPIVWGLSVKFRRLVSVQIAQAAAASQDHLRHQYPETLNPLLKATPNASPTIHGFRDPLVVSQFHPHPRLSYTLFEIPASFGDVTLCLTTLNYPEK